MKSKINLKMVPLLILSCLYIVCGITLFILGITFKAELTDFKQFIDYAIYLPLNLLLVIGFLMVIPGILGVISFITESASVMKLAGGFSFFVLLLEIFTCITAFNNENASDMLSTKMFDSMRKYGSDSIKTDMDFMQSNLKCCGVNNIAEWRDFWNLNKKDTGDNEFHAPVSCCERFSSNDPSVCDTYFKSGCLSKMNPKIYPATSLIGIIVASVAIVQFVGIIVAFTAAKKVESDTFIQGKLYSECNTH